MALEDLSNVSKQTIVIIALVFIIILKVYGLIKTKPAWYMIIALAIVAVITDASPTNASN